MKMKLINMKLSCLGIALVGALMVGSVQANPLWQKTTPVSVKSPAELTGETVPVDPGKKLEISFTARTTGEFTVEENARIRIINSNAGSSLNVEFFDTQNKRLQIIRLPVRTQSDYSYARVLYPPADAKSLRLSLAPAKAGELTVEKVQVTQDLTGEEAQCINPHPVFDYGDINDYGFGFGYGGGMFDCPDGKTVWNTGFTGASPDFPVAGGAQYELFCRGSGYEGRKSYLLLNFFKAAENKPFYSIHVKFSAQGESVPFRFPKEAVRASLLGYYVIVEELKIVKTPIPNSQK
jgi:hypothetical protein